MWCKGLSHMITWCVFFPPEGGFGVDFSSDIENLEEGLVTVAKGLLQHGVTSYCPTIVTSSQENYNEVNTIWKKLEINNVKYLN